MSPTRLDGVHGSTSEGIVKTYGLEVTTVAVITARRLFAKFHVFVVSDESWMWGIAAAQIGFKSMTALPVTQRAYDRAATFLGDDKLVHSSSDCRLAKPEEVEVVLRKHRIAAESYHDVLLLAELAEIDNAPQELWENAGTPVIVLGSRSACRRTWKMTRLRHRDLSGLTLAVGWAIWHGNGLGALDSDLLEIDKARYPPRPTNKFLNVASKLSGQGREVVWDAMEDGRAFPWPLPPTSGLARIPSVFRCGKPVTRPLEPKEMGNLLDLPLDLEDTVIERIWAGSKTGKVLRLKFHAEILLASVPWLDQLSRPSTFVITTSGASDKSKPCGDSLQRWLEMSQAVANHKLHDSSLAQMLYFAWVWDPNATAEVSTATKADDAKANEELWRPGGSSPTWEAARRALRHAMLSWWKRRITREACRWLRDQPNKRFDPEVTDCVRRAANAEWFDWADGSRLFFWRWPKRWIGEAKIGGKVFHLTKPPNRPRARRVPTEPHIQAMVD